MKLILALLFFCGAASAQCGLIAYNAITGKFDCTGLARKVIAYEVGDGTIPLTTAQLGSGAIFINDASPVTLTEASCISLVASQIVVVKIGATTKFTITCVVAASYSRLTTDGTTGYLNAAAITSRSIAAGAVLDLSGTGGTATNLKLFAYGR